MSLQIHTCEPGWEPVLIGELACVFPHGEHRELAAGWVESRLSDLGSAAPSETAPCLAFASQCLPDVQPLSAPSVSEWVKRAGELLLDRLAGHQGPWRLHVFGVPRPGGTAGPRRCQLIRQGLLELLRKKQRRLLRTLTTETTAGAGFTAPWSADEALAQVGLVSAETGYVSICPPEVRHALRRCLSRFPGGVVRVPADRRPPSRAFAKLREAEIRLGREIAAGETCVDLGASPGSWAWLALQRGARVVAVDRSPLRDDLMRHPRLTFVRGDAFRFTLARTSLPETVDWLLCDVIAYPDRVLGLLRDWLTHRRCRFFCVTIKFQGHADYPKLEPIKALLAESGACFAVRRLTCNKNEVTALGSLRGTK